MQITKRAVLAYFMVGDCDEQGVGVKAFDKLWKSFPY